MLSPHDSRCRRVRPSPSEADAACGGEGSLPRRGSLLRIAHAWLMQPIHCSTLGCFRLAFGICMAMQARQFASMYEEFASSKAVFPYPGFDFWNPVSPSTGEWVLLINKYAALLTAIGAGTRVATPVLFASFTYLFLNCISFHNNHYILICHVTFVASFTDWGRWCSVDSIISHLWRRERRRANWALGAREATTVPYWHLLAFQFLFAVPYAFGAVAKLNEDWLLRAQPLKVWLVNLAGLELTWRQPLTTPAL